MTLRSLAVLPTPLAAVIALFLSIQPVGAASYPAQLDRAVHNTNGVRTMEHTRTGVQTSPGATVSFSIVGREDDTSNRGYERESITQVSRDTTGRRRTLTYTFEVIFVHGLTYYRNTLDKNRWHSHNGTQYRDPISGTTFAGGRTTVPDYRTLNIALSATGAPRNEMHFHAPYTKPGFKGVLDVWVSGGSRPYVVREDEHGSGTLGRRRFTLRSHSTFGPFNGPVNIQPPATGSA